jgi:tetratricopeptide (TPR) repeat protein
VSFAVDQLIREKQVRTFVAFIKSLKKTPFRDAFNRAFGWDLAAFQTFWTGELKKMHWEKTKGAMSDEIHFQPISEPGSVGADVQGRLRIADRMRKQGHMEAALIEFEKALEEEPDNAVLLLKAARTHLVLNQKEEAIKKLERATSKNPNYGTAHVELARLLPAKEALYHYLEGNAINPFDPAIHEGLRNTYRELGREGDARQEDAVLEQLTK